MDPKPRSSLGRHWQAGAGSEWVAKGGIKELTIPMHDWKGSKFRFPGGFWGLRAKRIGGSQE